MSFETSSLYCSTRSQYIMMITVNTLVSDGFNMSVYNPDYTKRGHAIEPAAQR